MQGRTRKSWLILLPILAVGACGSSQDFTADVAGSYTVAVTNGANTCKFDDWVEGSQASGIGLVITQDGQKLHGTVGGVTALLFALRFGSAEFDGTVKGNSLTLTDYGKIPLQEGNCSYSYNATANATQTGDTITGTIAYSTKTNGNPDCQAVECSATQRFNGSRAPE